MHTQPSRLPWLLGAFRCSAVFSAGRDSNPSPQRVLDDGARLVNFAFAYAILYRYFQRNNSAVQPSENLDNTSTMPDQLPQVEADAEAIGVDILDRNHDREALAKVSGPCVPWKAQVRT
jgi:hypothetical protein